ncbi:MAG TPA: hypothetical protein VN788_12075 [Verrucomicrobiae bacterium]|nr:hypothetical protein [Terriglobales bacterium]HXU21310.1 hypothetical protein [Verrucomicrobiae bacterium]
MNKVLRNLAFALTLLVVPVGIGAQGGQGGGGFGGRGGGGGRGQGFPGGGRGARGGFVPNGPAGALAGRTDIYNSTNGVEPVGKATAAGEHFFIIGSVDQSQQQMLLKWPTEVTLLLKVTPDTKFSSEAGKPLKFADFRAGDTVWVSYKGTGADATAVHVRAGVMTVAELHQYYLDYPVIK